MQYDSTN